MVAYSFQPRFAEPILAGTKGGTIRATRRSATRLSGPRQYRQNIAGGHAMPGEMLQLYTGQRTKQCRRIADRKCIAADPIELHFYLRQIRVGDSPILLCPSALDAFAVFDGFADFDEMIEFWSPAEYFAGWHVRWLPLPAVR